ncbi:unnamed protein product [Ilex paraguariensis]|uniref:Uncharacterized protein n=1 Tax=Ilex paraguariensis TaxID=185542 RepID=A0ABC8S859_9AQUA
MAQASSFIPNTFLLMPTSKPHHLRNIIVCATPKRPVLRSKPPQTNRILHTSGEEKMKNEKVSTRKEKNKSEAADEHYAEK